MDPVRAVVAVRTLLDLLHREAPASEFERVVADARAEGAGPALLAEIEAAQGTALRLRDILQERRRREAELAALNRTAGDLAALRDPDLVLQAIVNRARSLLDTDTAYISLHDPAAGDTYLRVTAGSISTRFQRLRLALGEGIGGLVAALGTPYVTSDYFADERFRHTHVIDAGVREEGLVAMLAVPLRVGDTVIGVLFASDRRPRVFRPTEVSLLTSFAAHAAVAIDTANLLEETRATLAELAEANTRAREHNAAIERAAAAHDRFTGLVLAGAGVDDVVRAVADVVGGDATLLLGDTADDGADAPGGGRGDPGFAADFAAARAQARASGRGARVRSVHVVPVAAGTERLGLLVLHGAEDRKDFEASDTRILERAAMIIALLLLFRRSVAEAEHRLRGELLHEILSGNVRDRAALADRAARLGADLSRPHVAVVVDVPDADRSRLASAVAHLAATAPGLAGAVDGRTVLLLPGTRASEVARRVVSELGTAVGRTATAGSAGPARGVDEIADAYAQAGRCLDALYALGRRGEGASADELGFMGLLLSGSKDVGGFVRRTIGPLLDYDRDRRAELTRTVAAYFACGRSLTRTREVLHVHINTVTQRLERVAGLLGPNWRDPERELQIRLALHLRTMVPEDRGAPGAEGRHRSTS
ncbi:GAF domain-containing protein [Yinghuangia sp. ASG 101]|uniref:helix-turn-helix domain-containing protein n=1 Tax=Yinghuangia sp. ASG 101 TaxID=2896848 RepID=UPI001E3264CD|nr:GAF domain-containing protein [Yinghuangia sp. ASG 101]UGQ13179.1 GAF domain-containing protein [Yinghuangia sp. ASG 101]